MRAIWPPRPALVVGVAAAVAAIATVVLRRRAMARHRRHFDETYR